MYAAIIQNMTKAKEAGDLYQGSISINENKPQVSKTQSMTPTNQQNMALQSTAQETVKLQEKQKEETLSSMNLPAEELLKERW